MLRQMGVCVALTIEPHQELPALQLRNDLLDHLLDIPLVYDRHATSHVNGAPDPKTSTEERWSALTAHHDVKRLDGSDVLGRNQRH